MTDSTITPIKSAASQDDPEIDHEIDRKIDHEIDRTVRSTVDIAAPLARVFSALLDPAELATWWSSADSHQTHDWQVDARVGGKWSMKTVDSSGEEASVHGEYLVLDEPRVLEYSWHASWNDFAPTTVRYELSPAVVDGTWGTRLTVTHTGFYGFVNCFANCFVNCASAVPSRAHEWDRVIAGILHSAVLRPVMARAA